MQPGKRSFLTQRPGLITLISAGVLGLAIPIGVAVPSFATPPTNTDEPRATASTPINAPQRRPENATTFSQPSPAECERQRVLALRDPRAARGLAAELCATPTLPLPTAATERIDRRRDTRPARQRSLPRARGGGPIAPHLLCLGADRSTSGNCAAPDLVPTAPQQQWDRDPRMPPALQQNDPGPAEPGVTTSR